MDRIADGGVLKGLNERDESGYLEFYFISIILHQSHIIHSNLTKMLYLMHVLQLEKAKT